MGLGQRNQGRGGVEGCDLMAELGKGACVSAGAAAGVEDLGLIRQQRQEAALERSHIDFAGVSEERLRVLLVVVVVQVGH